MRTYYIHISRDVGGAWTLAIVKVLANSYEEAEYKALKAYHAYDDIGEITEEEARKIIKEDSIGLCILDENGNQIEED